VQAGFAIGSPRSPWRLVVDALRRNQRHKRPAKDFLGYRRLMTMMMCMIYILA